MTKLEKDPAKKLSVSIRQSQVDRAAKVMPASYRGNFSRFMQDALDNFLDLHEKKQPKRAS